MNVTRDGESDPEFAEHADGVELAGRLHDPPQHQRPERLVARPRANPSASYTPPRASHSIRALVASTTAVPASARTGSGQSNSSTC